MALYDGNARCKLCLERRYGQQPGGVCMKCHEKARHYDSTSHYLFRMALLTREMKAYWEAILDNNGRFELLKISGQAKVCVFGVGGFATTEARTRFEAGW